MPMIRANGTALYYEDTGGAGAPIVFSHGLLWNTTLFAPQIAVLKDRYRCIAYDHRGQGRSADDASHAIAMETVTDDAAALIEALGLVRFISAGLSMGGVFLPCGFDQPARSHRSLVSLGHDRRPGAVQAEIQVMMLSSRHHFGSRVVCESNLAGAARENRAQGSGTRRERLDWRQPANASNRRSIWRAAGTVCSSARASMGAPTSRLCRPLSPSATRT